MPMARPENSVVIDDAASPMMTSMFTISSCMILSGEGMKGSFKIPVRSVR